MIPGTDLLYMGQGQKEKKGAAKGKRGAGVWELERAKYDKTQDRCDSPIYTALLVLFGSDGNVFEPPQSGDQVCMFSCAQCNLLNLLKHLSNKQEKTSIFFQDWDLKVASYFNITFTVSYNQLDEALTQSCDCPMSERCPTSSCSFPFFNLQAQKKIIRERKLISNKRLTEWLLFCLGHVVLHTCQVL